MSVDATTVAPRDQIAPRDGGLVPRDEASPRDDASPRAIDRRQVATLVALTLITGAALALRFALFADVRANPFYDAAVRSMGQSWHNFFFGAFEPGAQVSIDKTPVDLWLQVASTKLLGFSSTSLRLPEALAGSLAVPLLYDTVRRPFGRSAGLVSAAVLAVLPVAVVTARSDTMDSLMVLFMVAASWCVVRGAQTRRTAPLLVAGAMLGLAFNVKLFESLLVVPAVLALAVLASDVPWQRLLRQLAGAALVYVLVALSWITAASLAPGRHPWPIGSTDGSVWNVIFVFNGTDRLGVLPTPAIAAADPVGPLRLFAATNTHYQLLIGSTLVAALAFGLAALALNARALLRDRSPAGRLRQGGTAWLGLWLVAGIALFSTMARLHPRYLEAMSPAVAGTAGVGLAALAAGARRRRFPAVVLALAAAATAAIVTTHGEPQRWAITAALVGAAVAVLAALVIAVLGAKRPSLSVAALVAGALVAVLAVPAAASIVLVSDGASVAGRPGDMAPGRVRSMSAYLRAHQGPAFYEFATSSVSQAGPLIVRDGRPVLVLTTLYGQSLITARQLAAQVHAGRVRYLLMGRATCAKGGVSKRCPPVVRWARDHATDVSTAAGLPVRGLLYRFDRAR